MIRPGTGQKAIILVYRYSKKHSESEVLILNSSIILSALLGTFLITPKTCAVGTSFW